MAPNDDAKKFAALEEKNNDLEKRLTKLEKRLSELEASKSSTEIEEDTKFARRLKSMQQTLEKVREMQALGLFEGPTGDKSHPVRKEGN